MKKLNKSIFIILVIAANLSIIRTKQSASHKLQQIDQEILKLQKINHIYHEARFQYINSHQRRSQQSNDYANATQFDISHQRQYDFRISEKQCGISGTNINNILLKDNQNIFIGINVPSSKQFNIYDTECQLIKTINNLQVQLVLSSRSSYAQSVYFIGNGNLCSFQDISVSSMENFRVLAKLDNQNVAGGFVRLKEGIRTEIFIIYQNGNIKKYDQMGNLQLTITSEKLELINNYGQENQVQILDRYPHPLLLQNQWIYTVDTNKYSKQVSDCPYIPGIRHLYLDSSYSSLVYALTDTKIYVLEFKNSKKTCHITDIYPIQSFFQQSNLIIYRNAIFMSNIVLNLTTMETSYFKCDKFSFQHTVNNRGTQNPQTLVIDQCCNDQKCLIRVSALSENYQSNYSVLIWIILGFLFILFLSFKFFRRSSGLPIDYDQQLKYNAIHEQIASCVQPIKKNKKGKKT